MLDLVHLCKSRRDQVISGLCNRASSAELPIRHVPRRGRYSRKLPFGGSHVRLAGAKHETRAVLAVISAALPRWLSRTYH